MALGDNCIFKRHLVLEPTPNGTTYDRYTIYEHSHTFLQHQKEEIYYLNNLLFNHPIEIYPSRQILCHQIITITMLHIFEYKIKAVRSCKLN